MNSQMQLGLRVRLGLEVHIIILWYFSLIKIIFLNFRIVLDLWNSYEDNTHIPHTHSLPHC